MNKNRPLHLLAELDREVGPQTILVAEGFGGTGFRLDDPELAGEVLQQARQAAAAGRPALVNAILGRSDFRKGSISM